MKSIVTTYMGPTNFKGSRIKADDGDGNRVFLSYQSEINSTPNHMAACKALCEKMGWGGRLQGGSILKNGNGCSMVWVWIDKQDQLYVKPLKSFTHGEG